MAAVQFAVGRAFSSFEKLEAEVKAYQNEKSAIETKEVIDKMFQMFKTHNPKWSQTRVVVLDKDFTECAVFKKEFPTDSLFISLFHTLRTLKRKVSREKLGLLPGEHDHALELLTAIVYSSSSQQYEDNYKDLKVSGLK